MLTHAMAPLVLFGLNISQTTRTRSFLTSLTRAANPFMINKKIIFTFLMCMQVSFKLNSAKEQPSLQKEAHPGSQPHSQKGGRIQ